MMKWIHAKKVFGCLAAAALFAVCGCGNGSGEETAGSGNGVDGDYVYVAEYKSLNDYCDSIHALRFGGDKLFFAGMKEDKDVLYSMIVGGDDVKEFPLELEKGMHVNVLGNDAEGNLLLGMIQYEGDPEAGGTVKNVVIRKCSPEGEELETVETGNAFAQMDSMSFYLSSLLQDKEGNYYLGSSKEVYVLRKDGSLYCEIPIGQYLTNLFAMKDGRVVAAYYGNNGWCLEEVNPSQKSLQPLASSIVFDYGTYQGGVDTDLLYTQNAILYTCNLGDEKPTALLNWMDSDIDSNNLSDFTILSDGRIAAVTRDYSAGATELGILTKKDRSEVPEKEILTYASLYVPYFAEKDIVAFNKQSEKYRIVVKEYGDDSMSYADRAALLNADLTGANPPDIIDLEYSTLSLEELVDAGVVEDLSPYLDGDTVIKREDYVENALRAYEWDGKLYGIMSCFGIQTVVGKVSDVGEGSTWTVDDVLALADSQESGVEIFNYADRTNVLHKMCALNEELFIDRENGTCDFSKEEFYKILEFASRFPQEYEYDPNAPSEIEKIRSGKLLLLSEPITAVSQYQMYEYEFGEPVNFIGYPTFGKSGLTLVPNSTTVAMHASSENKEGVWEFIRFNLTEKRQENMWTANAGFPILKSALDKVLADAMEDEYYEDEDGNKKLTSKMTWTTGDFTVEVYAATKEQVDRIREMIDTAQPGGTMEEKLYDIIREEAQAYFDGQKKAEDVAALIQNRVQTYLDETR